MIKGREPLACVCSHFAECIKDGKRPKSGGENALRVVRVLEAAERSLRRNGRKVRL